MPDNRDYCPICGFVYNEPWAQKCACEQKEYEMNLPETKYQINDELYHVNGAQCSCFKVTALNFVVLNNNTINYCYLSEDAQTKKVIRGLENDLFMTWEAAKEAMKKNIQMAVNNTWKQLDECQDPYSISEETK